MNEYNSLQVCNDYRRVNLKKLSINEISYPSARAYRIRIGFSVGSDYFLYLVQDNRFEIELKYQENTLYQLYNP